MKSFLLLCCLLLSVTSPSCTTQTETVQEEVGAFLIDSDGLYIPITAKKWFGSQDELIGHLYEKDGDLYGQWLYKSGEPMGDPALLISADDMVDSKPASLNIPTTLPWRKFSPGEVVIQDGLWYFIPVPDFWPKETF